MSVADRHIGVMASSPSQPPVMHTVLNAFCTSFETSLRPILDPVKDSATALTAAPDDIPARRMLPKLRELHHQLESLVDKVAAQQAYVLIFGPLKSGKSTFMNALSGSYVSEVTSLPAYPCMVYVEHAAEPGMEVTHYDGRTTSFTQNEALREFVAVGHRDLTRRIREVEAQGDTFDPAVHMPEAIRKIDVKIAIEHLAQSGAVLVDTPGLYTRMKFGYDRMTRDFRNAAACAIFIVKTDNLFLEQVFDEFGELLELFSRIFLVVNVDSTKMDLQPNGALTPSLEQKQPWAVIEAFEHLSMTEPLMKAVEEGRLEIYPVDLLRAASRRLQARAGNGAWEPEDEVEAEEPGRPIGFQNVLQDLTEFLNSNEYLKAFLDDSLRRSRTLVDDLDVTLQDERVQQLTSEVAAVREARDQAQSKTETIVRLQHMEWRAHVQGLAPGLVEHVKEVAGQIKADAPEAVDQAIETWFESDQSLNHLLEQELHPIFAAMHGRLVREAEETMKRRASENLAGLASAADVLADLANVGVQIRATADAALVHLKAGAATISPQPQLASNIPVRRSFADWLLLRSEATVRQRLFGPAERPDTEIPAASKARLLGQRGREALRQVLLARLVSLLDEAESGVPDQLVQGYAERFEEALLSLLERAQQEANQQLDAHEQRLRKVQQANDSVKELAAVLPSFSLSVDMLTDQFGQNGEAPLAEHAFEELQ